MVGRMAGRQDVVDKVLAPIGKQKGEPLTLADLCRIAGVSERTLHYAFKEHCTHVARPLSEN